MEKKLEGKTLDGEKRSYTFQLMDARTGLELEFGKLAYVLYNDALIEMINEEGFELNPIALRSIVTGLYEFEDLEEFAEKMLNGAKIGLDKGAPFECDDKGICDFFTGDGPEFATALFYAMCANYPKAIIPLLEAGAAKKNASTPPNTTPKKTTKTSQKSSTV